MFLVHWLFVFQSEMSVYPIGNTCNSRLISNRNPHWPLEQFNGIKYIVYFLVLQCPISMDTGTCIIKIHTYKRIVCRDLHTKLFPEIISQVSNNSRINTI